MMSSRVVWQIVAVAAFAATAALLVTLSRGGQGVHASLTSGALPAVSSSAPAHGSSGHGASGHHNPGRGAPAASRCAGQPGSVASRPAPSASRSAAVLAGPVVPRVCPRPAVRRSCPPHRAGAACRSR